MDKFSVFQITPNTHEIAENTLGKGENAWVTSMSFPYSFSHKVLKTLVPKGCRNTKLPGIRLFSPNATLSCIITFPNKPLFLRACSVSLSKTLWEKEKLLVKSKFFFSYSVFYPFRELSTIFIKFKIVVCRLFHFWNSLEFFVS